MTNAARRETPAHRALLALETLRVIGDTAPTDDQRSRLLDWPGWGALAPAFGSRPSRQWAAVSDRLDQHYADRAADLTVAADYLDTSFFTPDHIIDGAFAILRAAGFTGGAVLEPGCGSGRFMARTPSDMQVDWTGIDVDPTATRMARLLSPGARIITSPLQKIALRSGSFDAVVGNVPFGKVGVHDPAYDATTTLHGYFLLRALDAVRVGGLVVLAISRYVMDSPSIVRQISETANVIGAIRLPSGTFSDEGTEAIADLLVLQKRESTLASESFVDNPDEFHRANMFEEPVGQMRITESVRPGASHDFVRVSTYWRDYPEHVAGRMLLSGFSQAPLVVRAEEPVSAAVAAIEALLPVIPALGAPDDHLPNFDDVVLTDEEGRKEGAFHVIGGRMHQVRSGALLPVERANAELHALVELRDAALALREAESDAARPDDSIEPLRTAAHALYLDYVATFGELNRGDLVRGKVDPDTDEPTLSYRRPRMGGFRQDPDYVTVLAMEEFDQNLGVAAPAPILLRRVNRTPERATSADNAAEALAITRGEGRGIDLDRVGELLGITGEAEIVAQLGELIYRSPADDQWVIDRDYLSGNVRTKLAEAERAAALDDRFQRNVEALQAVMPADLGPLDIRVSLGAPWIDPSVIDDFQRDTFGRVSPTTYTSLISYWELADPKTRPTAEARLKWGTPEVGPHDLLENSLNGRSRIVYDEVRRGDRMVKVKNARATMAAEEKQAALQDHFSQWVWEDSERAATICAEYNVRFNSHVVRRPNGAHLTFPGMAEGISLWDHQKDAVDGIISNARYMLGHAVGAGKTSEMIAGAMTLRRLGLANKPMIAVPNHLLEQVAREAQQLYPTGNILIANKEDLQGSGRRLFAARCAAGSWDLVVMTHQAFTSLPVAPEVEEHFIETQKAELRAYLQSAKDSGDDQSRGGKMVARAVRALDKRLHELRENRKIDEGMVLFEHLGVDWIGQDEAHLYKRLPITTRADGFSLGSSKRAVDLLLKINTLAERRPGKPVTAFFTGTPWSNTLAETFVWQTYLQPERLAEMGVAHFDAWAATFVRYEMRVEVTPDGNGFRMRRRPVAIQNFAEMRSAFSEIADLLPGSALNLVRPDANRRTVVATATDAQRAFVKQLGVRADALRAGEPIPRADGGEGEDNILLVCSDGRKVALDPILVKLADDSPKLLEVADNIARTYHEHSTTEIDNALGVFQLALCDLGTPHPDDAQTYGRLRRALIERGVPADMIRFIHDAKTDKARAQVFAACRDGRIAVLVGSTEKVGTGTNIQRRLKAIHHVDPPWRASDMEQRDGRGIRPGNKHAVVDIVTYITQGTFDAYMYQLIERKQRFMSQLYTADSSTREVEDIADVVLSFGEIKALAAGNPLLLEQSEATANLKRLRVLESLHRQAKRGALDEADRNERTAAQLDATTADLVRATASLTPETNEDLRTLAIFATAIERNERATRLRFRGLSLDFAATPGNIAIDTPIGIADGLNMLTKVTVERKDIRRGAVAIAAILREAFGAWLVSLRTVVAQNTRDARRLREEAARGRAAAAAIVFEHAADLTAARVKLDRIERAIEGAAEESESAIDRDSTDAGGTPVSTLAA